MSQAGEYADEDDDFITPLSDFGRLSMLVCRFREKQSCETVAFRAVKIKRDKITIKRNRETEVLDFDMYVLLSYLSMFISAVKLNHISLLLQEIKRATMDGGIGDIRM